jgi:hypothetical protein
MQGKKTQAEDNTCQISDGQSVTGEGSISEYFGFFQCQSLF